MPRPTLPTVRFRPEKDLRGRVVAITGAGSGIGRALALACAQRGARLALSDISEDGLAQTVRLVESAGAAAQSRVLDVSDAEAMDAWAAEVHAHYGVVNVLFSNAGVSLTGDFADLPLADMQWIVGINFWGVVHSTRSFLPHLIASGEGHVVTISSLFGLLSMPSQSMYNATKFAVRGLSESLREEMLVAGHPVDVTVVHPGGIKTSIVRSGRFSEQTDAATTTTHFDQKLARLTPDQAAEIILSGVVRRKPRVLVGIDAHLVHNMARFVGARYQDIVAKAAAAGGMP